MAGNDGGPVPSSDRRLRGKREHKAFTAEQLRGLEQSKLTGRERRLLATIYDRENRATAAREQSGTGQAAELAREVERLEEVIRRLTGDCSHHRCLIVATRDRFIEIYADPVIKAHVICLPDLTDQGEWNEAVEWALSKLPHEFRNMQDDPTIRPKLESVKCMDKIHWRYFRNRLQEIAGVEQLAAAIEDIKSMPAEAVEDVGF